MKHNLLFIDLLQDSKGQVYWFMFNVDNYKVMNFKFWEFLEVIEEFNIIFNVADCNTCPLKEDNHEDEEDLS